MYYKQNNKLLSSVPDEFITKHTKDFLSKFPELTDTQKQVITPILLSTKDYNDFFKTNYHKSTRYLKALYSVPMLSLGRVIYHKNYSLVVLPLYYIYQFQEFLARETKIILNLKELTPLKNLERLQEQFIKFGIGNLENTLHIHNKVYLKNSNKVLYYEVKSQILKIKKF